VELPRLEPLYQEYRDQGLQIVAIDGASDTERAQAFIAEHGLSYPTLENGEDDIAGGLFGIRAYPTSYLIDGEGRILAMHVGFDEGDEDMLEEEIRRVLGS
jgi:peroxiredoxin